MRKAELGSVSHGTLKTDDLLEAFADELEHQIFRNGDYFSLPENFAQRDRLNLLVDLAREIPAASEEAVLLTYELEEALNEFAPDGAYFGAHPGDGTDFGFWRSED